MKYRELVNALAEIGVDDPKSEAGIILEHLFGVNSGQIICDPEKDYNEKEITPILEKRKMRIPLQHITGKWYFMGREFFVSKECLIPRADTEILVEKAVKELKTGGSVADLCTGSGCIGISMLVYRPDISKMLLCDISNGALNMAMKNADLNGVKEKCSFLLADITKDLPSEKYDMIVSNPPYIPSDDIKSLSPEVQKEPTLALDGGKDGLQIIDFLLNEGLEYLKDDGKMLIEFG